MTKTKHIAKPFLRLDFETDVNVFEMPTDDLHRELAHVVGDDPDWDSIVVQLRRRRVGQNPDRFVDSCELLFDSVEERDAAANLALQPPEAGKPKLIDYVEAGVMICDPITARPETPPGLSSDITLVEDEQHFQPQPQQHEPDLHRGLGPYSTTTKTNICQDSTSNGLGAGDFTMTNCNDINVNIGVQEQPPSHYDGPVYPHWDSTFMAQQQQQQRQQPITIDQEASSSQSPVIINTTNNFHITGPGAQINNYFSGPPGGLPGSTTAAKYGVDAEPESHEVFGPNTRSNKRARPESLLGRDNASTKSRAHQRAQRRRQQEQRMDR